MEAKMFCFQCQEAAKGTGCTIKGVCGKDDKTANRMDLLLFITKGIATAATLLHNAGIETSMQVNHFTTDALFSTITNANFDIECITGRIIKGLKLRNELITIAKEKNITLPVIDELVWNGDESSFEGKSQTVGVLRETNEDIRSLKELTIYGLKGMAAYVEHAANLGYEEPNYTGSSCVHSPIHYAKIFPPNSSPLLSWKQEVSGSKPWHCSIKPTPAATVTRK